MSNKPHVVQAKDGSYIKGITAWEKELVTDINQARIYPSKDEATRSVKHCSIYIKHNDEHMNYKVVPVLITVDATD